MDGTDLLMSVEDDKRCEQLIDRLDALADRVGAADAQALIQHLTTAARELDRDEIHRAIERERKIKRHNESGGSGGRPSVVDEAVSEIRTHVESDAVGDEMTDEVIHDTLFVVRERNSRPTFYKLKKRVRDEFGIDTEDYVDNP